MLSEKDVIVKEIRTFMKGSKWEPSLTDTLRGVGRASGFRFVETLGKLSFRRAICRFLSSCGRREFESLSGPRDR
jgi:hypothetical protein